MATATTGIAGSSAILDKVRKLLAKAETTDNTHEADAFSAKAAELIAAHRISPDRVALGPGRLVVRRIVLGRGGYVRARLALLVAVANAHDCEVVFETGLDGTTALVAGFSTDLDAVAVLYESLHLQAASQMMMVRRPTAAATQRWRRSFLFGFASRIADLLADARESAEATASPGTGSTSVPDLPARAEQVRRFAATAFGRVTRAAPARASAPAAWGAGHRAATGVDIGRGRVATRAAIGPARGRRAR